MSSGGTSRVNQIAIDPTNTNIIYVATDRGLHKSSNGGLFWSVLNPSSGLATYNSIAIDRFNHLTLYAGSGIGFESILKSTDGGATWTSSSTGLTFPLGGLIFNAIINRIAMDPVTPSTITSQQQMPACSKVRTQVNWNPVPQISQHQRFGCDGRRNNPESFTSGQLLEMMSSRYGLFNCLSVRVFFKLRRTKTMKQRCRG